MTKPAPLSRDLIATKGTATPPRTQHRGEGSHPQRPWSPHQQRRPRHQIKRRRRRTAPQDLRHPCQQPETVAAPMGRTSELSATTIP